MLSLDNSHDAGEQSEKLFVCGDKSHIFVFLMQRYGLKSD